MSTEWSKTTKHIVAVGMVRFIAQLQSHWQPTKEQPQSKSFQQGQTPGKIRADH
jgi:hypothetical protein